MTISTIKGANKLCQSYIMMETVYIVITIYTVSIIIYDWHNLFAPLIVLIVIFPNLKTFKQGCHLISPRDTKLP